MNKKIICKIKELLRFIWSKIKISKRAGLNGSLTIEAAIVLPVFMIFILGVTYILFILNAQTLVQTGMEETSRKLTRQIYLEQRTGSDELIVNPLTMGAMLLNSKAFNAINIGNIKGGKQGVNTLLSTYDEEKGIVDIVASYTYSIPLLPDHIADVPLAQRMRSRAWIGRELDTNGSVGTSSEATDRDETKKVYVTETGTVYHTSLNCSYLDLSIRSTAFQDLEKERNKSGGKYYRCPICSKNASGGGVVYITDYGENWHTSLECSGLKRTVVERDISTVDLPACSKCGNKH